MNKKELIQGYFLNTLSPEAKNEFDHYLEIDPDFAKHVAFEKNLQTVIKKEQQDAVKATLKDFDGHTKSSYRPYKIWWIAASIIVILAIPGIIYFGQNTPSNADLFAEHFEPYKNIIAPISRGGEDMSKIKSAFISYDKEDYAEASKQFEDLYALEKQSYLLFYQSICELELNNSEKAITLLSQHKNYTDRLSNQTNWYLALAYLSAEKTQEAKLLLKLVVDKKQYNYKLAKDLLDALE